MTSVIFYLYEFILQVSPSVFINFLVQQFSLSAIAIAQIGMLYFYTYAAMQVPAGFLIDRYGVQKTLTLAALFCATGTVIFSFSSSFFMLLSGRCITAIGSAFAMVGSMKVATLWLPKSQFALLSGIILFVGMLGVILGKAPLAYLTTKIGWQNAIFWLGISGFFLAILLWSTLKTAKQTLPAKTCLPTHDYKNLFLTTSKKTFKNKQIWLIAIYGGLMVSPVISMGALWGEKYLIDAYNYTQVEAAASISPFFMGMAIGGPFSGWLSDKLNRRKLLMFIGTIGSFICLNMFIYTSHFPDFFYHILGFLIGFFVAFSWVTFALVREITPEKENAFALGFVNFLNMILAATSQGLIGILLEFFHGSASTVHYFNYTEHDYELAFMIFPIFIAIAFVLTFFIEEKDKSR